MRGGLYVHLPFCRRRCGYCDFYAEIAPVSYHDRMVEGILGEARHRRTAWNGVSFDSVYIGGGTPSLVGPEPIARLLAGLLELLRIAPDAEWTLEANPDSASGGLLDAAFAGGVNRLSLGIQSFHDRQLALLDRLHDADAARTAFRRARVAGFDNLNLDLIYGLPDDERLEAWEETLREAVELRPEHISCYLLTLERDVPMARAVAAGAIDLPGETVARRAYGMASRMLREAGYEQYEISNWALPNRRCRHNQEIWEGERYLGLGPGAHGYDGRFRRANRPGLDPYLEAIESGGEPPHEEVPVDEACRREERILLGLRLRDGLAWDRLESEFGGDRVGRLRARAGRWTPTGLLEDDGSRLRIGEKGLFVSNALIAELIDAL